MHLGMRHQPKLESFLLAVALDFFGVNSRAAYGGEYPAPLPSDPKTALIRYP